MSGRLNGRISHRALVTALRIRAEAVALASEQLAGTLSLASLAAEAERSAIAAICREAEAANSLDADDLTVEAFAAWLPSGRQAVLASRARRNAAEAAVVVARAGLAAARSAEAATDAMVAERAKLLLDGRLRSEQIASDEAGSRGKRQSVYRSPGKPE